MEQSDHVTLILPLEPPRRTPITFSRISHFHSRKSLRRSWNQLSRCQRNLIILAISAACITAVLFLPGDQVVTKTSGNQPSLPLTNDGGLDAFAVADHVNVAPFKGHDLRQKTIQNLNDRNVKTFQHKAESSNYASDDFKKEMAEEEEKKSHHPLGNDNNYSRLQKNEPKIENDKASDTIGTSSNFDKYTEPLRITFKGPGNNRQNAVVAAFKHSWEGYKKYAWGHDNLKPISGGAHDWFGLGLTIVDSLDTMYIMNLQEEFQEARNWVDQSLNFDKNRDVNLFEVTIRVLGGLLSVYHLTGDQMFLDKSVDLGNRLLPCFNSPSGIPYSDVNLALKSAHPPKWSPDSSTSEVTTLQLEFRDLSRSTNNPIYEKAAQRVSEKVHLLEKNNGLVPIFIDVNSGTFRNGAKISLGARGDSYYEYLLKQWIQTGRNQNNPLIEDYKTAIEGVISQLVRKTPREGHLYIGELNNGRDFKPKMDHLTCYLPGTLLLGYKYGMPESHLQLAKDLLETCYQTYIKQPTGLAPEISYFATKDDEDPEITVKPSDTHNLLRPEFIESLYLFFAITGESLYQDMGWRIFQNFEKYTKVDNGYTSIGNVCNVVIVDWRDMMESFWLSETLKYFYLLFSDNQNELDLEKFVINTEAHPIPIRRN